MTTKKGKTTGAAQRPSNTKPKAEAYISFNKAESAALAGVCLRSLRVYFELKWLANFRTGMVGAFGRQKLTYEAIATRVAIPTSQGRSATSNMIDGKEVARIIQRLEQAGLVEDILNSKEGLTLRLPMSPMRAMQPQDVQLEQTEQESNEPQEQATAATHEAWERPEPMRAPMPEPTQAPDDDEDDWDWEEPESATSPATSSEIDGNQAGKLPTESMPEWTANPHKYEDFSESEPTQSVLVKTEGQYSFSVPDSVRPASALRALADVGIAGAPTEHLGEPCRPSAAPFEGEENPNLNAGQIRERIRFLCPQFPYLDTQVSATFFQRVAGLDVTIKELDDVAQSLVNDPRQKLTAGALFDCLVAKRRRPRRVGGLVL